MTNAIAHNSQPFAEPHGVVEGHIHSFESCGTVDGPGIRFVVFTTGCPLRCQYCSNPDCRHVEDGRRVTADAVVAEIKKYTTYMRTSGGGVTITGGEPLYQPHFVAEVFRQCKALGIHTALDTSGYADLFIAKAVLPYVDLVLLDIKSFIPETFEKVTGVEIDRTLALARYLNEIGKPAWVRFVLVPGLSSDRANIEGLADFLASMTNVERVEVLPFHKMGEYKWEQLGYEYQLKDTQPPPPEMVQETLEIFRSRGLKAV